MFGDTNDHLVERAKDLEFQVLKFQIRLVSPTQIELKEFLQRASKLISELGKERFLMIDHDFKVDVNRAYDDSVLWQYLNDMNNNGNKLSRNSQFCIASNNK